MLSSIDDIQRIDWGAAAAVDDTPPDARAISINADRSVAIVAARWEGDALDIFQPIEYASEIGAAGYEWLDALIAPTQEISVTGTDFVIGGGIPFYADTRTAKELAAAGMTAQEVEGIYAGAGDTVIGAADRVLRVSVMAGHMLQRAIVDGRLTGYTTAARETERAALAALALGALG